MNGRESDKTANAASSRQSFPPLSESDFAQISMRTKAILLALLGATTLAVSALVATHTWQIGIRGEWQWPYFAAPPLWIAAAPAAVLALLLVAIVAVCLRGLIQKASHELAAAVLCLALSLGVILEMGKANPAAPYDAYDSIVAPWAGGYYAESVHITNMRGYLRNYAGMISQLQVKDRIRGHIADHPAGPVVFHWAVNRVLERWPAGVRWFTPENADEALRFSRGAPATPRGLACDLAHNTLSDAQFAGIWASALLFRLGYWLALIPVYLLARDLYSREAGLIALALAALIPSLHLFGPYPDQLFPLVAVGAAYAWHRALRGGNAGWAAFSAVIAFIGLLWSMALVVVVAFLGLYGVLAAWRGVRSGDGLDRRGWLRVIAGWLIGFLVCSLLPMPLFGYDVWRVWKICLSQHATFGVLFPRSYSAWALFNPVEFALFTGLPTALLLALVAAMDLRRWWRDRGRTAISPLPWALLVVLAALDFSGKNLGEVARLWMFLMPVAAIAASCPLAGLDRRAGWVAAYVLALAAAQLAAFKLSLNVFGL